MRWISKDGKIILVNRGIRSFGYGFISVLLGIYLTELGFEPFQVGILLSAAIAGGAIFTIITGRYAVIYGLKKMLLFSIILSLLGIVIFLMTENITFLILGALMGFLSPSGRELGPFLSLEQAYLPFTVDDANRTKAFTFWNIIATFAVATGSLFAAVPNLLQEYFGLGRILSLKYIFIFYLFLNITAFLLYARISEVRYTREKIILTEKSKKIITKLSFLFAIDSLGGGFVITSILSLWFYSKFNAPVPVISGIFFAAGLLEALSFYLSSIMAKKIGLVNTMVFTHIPSSIFLILIPFMPDLYLAAALYLLRQLLSEMDIPPRQSYVVAVVRPEEKSIATSTTNVAKILASAIGPTIAGRVLLLTAFSPFVIGGTFKIIYDVILYFNFRNLKPPEEIL